MVGERVGKLVVIKKAGSNERKDILWECLCDCGNTKIVRATNLKQNHTKSCGCLKHGVDRTKIEGNKFHSLTITKFLHADKFRESIYEYKCDCGNVGVIRLQKIGKNKNCPNCRRKTHGEISGNYWSSLKHGAKQRNLEFSINPKQAWEIFLKQEGKCAITGIDLKISRNSKFRKSGLQTASLDRIDNNKGYTENNIQWVHKKINELRWDLSIEEFIDWCEKVVSHNKKKEENK